MMGLIQKELYVNRKYIKTTIGFMIFYLLLNLIEKKGASSAVICGIVLPACMMSISSYAMDEKVSWDLFGNCLPVKRSDVILSKYLYVTVTTILIAFFMGSMGICANILTGQEDTFSVIKVIFPAMGVALLFNAITIPFLLYFGNERGRIYTMMFIALIISVFYAIKTSLYDQMEGMFQYLAYFGEKLLLPASILVLLLSWYISCYLYYRKEF